MRTLVVLLALVVVAGFVIAATMHTLLGPILLIAGVASLLVMTIPSATQRIAEWLSVGSFGRRRD